MLENVLVIKPRRGRGEALRLLQAGYILYWNEREEDVFFFVTVTLAAVYVCDGSDPSAS